MKKKTLLLVSLLGLMVTGCGTDKPTETTPVKPTEKPTETAKPTETGKPTEAPVVKTPDYYLSGNINLGEVSEKKFVLDEATKTYTLEGVSLKRGDTFFVRGTEDAALINFESLASKDGFEKGNGNYVSVLNEGIYTLTIKEGVLTMTKTASNYHAVKIVYEDGRDSLDFTLQDDFTFTLENAPIRYRQKFYIDMDGEKLGFDSLAFNPAYYKAFRFEDNGIESIKKGNFNFAIDFSLKQPLVITSDAIEEENVAPSDGDAYKKFIKKFDDQFANEGTKFTLTSETTSGDTVTKKVVEETLDVNQHFIQRENYTYSADQTAEGAITEEKGKENAAIAKKEAVFNSTNYYEIATYEGSSLTNPTVDGAIIKEETPKVEAADEPASTMVHRERKYVTKEKAAEKMISYQSEYKTVNNILSYMIGSAHVSGNSAFKEDEIKEHLTIKSEYLGDIGDAIKMTFTNYEAVYAAYGNSYYATDELEITLSEDGKLTDGVYKVNVYSGNKIFTDDKKPVDNIADFLTKSENITFHMDYETRQELSEFKIPLSTSVASEIEATAKDQELSCLVSSLDASTLGVLAVEPAAPLDLGNFKIMDYDKKFFDENYNKSLAGKGVIGTTVITLGNEYNMVTYDVNVTLVYAEFEKYYQLGSIMCGDKAFSSGYVGESYDCIVTPSEGYDPTDVSITASSDAITISKMNTDEDKKATGKIKFTVTINRAETGVSINVASISKPTIKNSVVLTLNEPWTKEKVAATYGASSNANAIKYIVFNADGTGLVRTGSSIYNYIVTDEYAFTYDVDAKGVVTLKTSEHVTELQMTMQNSEQFKAASSGFDKITYRKVKIDKVAIDNVDKNPGYYSTYTELSPIFSGGNYTITDEAGKEYTFVKTEMQNSFNDGYIFFKDETTTSKFEIVLPNSSYSSYGVGAKNYYADATGSTTTPSGSYTYSAGIFTVTFGSKVFTFTPKAK